jgi:hypothetical protein
VAVVAHIGGVGWVAYLHLYSIDLMGNLKTELNRIDLVFPMVTTNIMHIDIWGGFL